MVIPGRYRHYKSNAALKNSRYSFFHAGCPHNIVQMLAGHAAQGVHDQVYVHREALPLKLLQKGLEKLQYSDVLKRLSSDSI
jgi:integrase